MKTYRKRKKLKTAERGRKDENITERERKSEWESTERKRKKKRNKRVWKRERVRKRERRQECKKRSTQLGHRNCTAWNLSRKMHRETIDVFNRMLM